MTQPYDVYDDAISRRRTFVRVGLFVVILGTMPFYVLGFILWGTASDADAGSETTIATATNTAIGENEASATPLDTSTPIVFATIDQLRSTPLQYNPPVVIPTNPPAIIPTSTNAPTLTLFPTNTPVPQATNTEAPTDVPLPTDTEIPTEIPLPTNTEIPTEAPLPSPTPLPPPSDTPAPEVTADP